MAVITGMTSGAFVLLLLGAIFMYRSYRVRNSKHYVYVDVEETPFTALAPSFFNDEGYHGRAARMEAHLEANDLWEAVEEDYEVSKLSGNPIMVKTLSCDEEEQCFVASCDENISQGKSWLVDKAQVVDQEEEELLFVASNQEEGKLFVSPCYEKISQGETWLVDSGCTNHMTNNVELFEELDRKSISKVRVGNEQYISVKGKGSIVIETLMGTKVITDVMYVPEIHQNLLSVGQLLENGFEVHFEDKTCMIRDAKGLKLFSIKMTRKSFQLDLMDKEQTAYQASVKTTDLWHKMGVCSISGKEEC